MITNSSFLSLNVSCQEALQLAKTRLSLAGLQALQTFDLQTARLASHDCSCPNHGTEACDCQMVVLLVYGETANVSTLPAVVNTSPVTLILHGNGGQTWFSIADDLNQKVDKTLQAAIRNSLEHDVTVAAE